MADETSTEKIEEDTKTDRKIGKKRKIDLKGTQKKTNTNERGKKTFVEQPVSVAMHRLPEKLPSLKRIKNHSYHKH